MMVGMRSSVDFSGNVWVWNKTREKWERITYNEAGIAKQNGCEDADPKDGVYDNHDN